MSITAATSDGPTTVGHHPNIRISYATRIAQAFTRQSAQTHQLSQRQSDVCSRVYTLFFICPTVRRWYFKLDVLENAKVREWAAAFSPWPNARRVGAPTLTY